MLPAFLKGGEIFSTTGKGTGLLLFYVLFLSLLVHLAENEYICSTINEGFIGLMIINLRKPCRIKTFLYG